MQPSWLPTMESSRRFRIPRQYAQASDSALLGSRRWVPSGSIWLSPLRRNPLTRANYSTSVSARSSKVRQLRYEVPMSVSRAGPSPLVLLLAVLAAAIWGVTASAEAQQAPAAPAAGVSGTAPSAANPAASTASPQPLNVMVVNIQTLLRKSKAAGTVLQQLEQKRTEYAKEMSKQDEVLRHENETLQQ